MATQGKKLAGSARERARLRTRKKISGTDERPRLTVFRSSKHTYAQLVSDDSHKTLASAPTRDKDVANAIKDLKVEGTKGKASLKSVAAARAVGLVLARRSTALKIERIVFDRNGFLYTGRVQALADGAREGGLRF